MGTIVSVFGISPGKIGSQESFARELSLQVGQCGWQSVLCFAQMPPPAVANFLSLPNVRIELVRESWRTNYSSVADLIRVLGRYRPDILHLHFTGFLGPYPWIAKLLSVEKVFFTDHSSRPIAYVPKEAALWKKALARVINQPITRVISGSRYGYDCLRTMGLLPADRFRVIYNAVDFSRVTVDPSAAKRLRQKYSIPDGRSLVVQVSWIIPEKGIVDLVEAARLLITRKDDVHFLLVGDGAYREHCVRVIDEMGLNDHVTWTGMIQDPFQEGVFAASDVICQVSRWQELFGYTIAEAMASCRPVVATRVGGIPEIVQDEVTGFLVPPQEPARIAEKILLLLQNKALRESMGRAGRQVAESKFNLRLNVAQLLDLYGVHSNG